MVKIILSGANGAMGSAIIRSMAGYPDCEIVAGIDKNPQVSQVFPVFESLEACTIPADVVIDFSHPSALTGLLSTAKQRNLPIVIATTGMTETQVQEIHEAAKTIPVFYTANMSLGINLLRELAILATRILGGNFDIEIVDKHHNKKLDSPSGTAIMLADAIRKELPEETEYVYDRHNSLSKRGKHEIGLHGVRGGTIVGDHDIIFAGQDEVITLSHHAASKEVFANGSIRAAVYLYTQAPGLYDMPKLVQGILS